ncbi:MAG: protein kinase, partial [Bacteroidota bacterium]
PENIMIRKDGRVQIMDFGLAKLRGASRLTKEGSTVGTAGYMSPEQVQGLETDHRSDIFSLGVLLYEMLSGQPPFKGVHETAIAYEVVNVDSPPMSSLRPDISPELDAIVLECLEKDPNERAQSAKQIAIDLNRFKRTSSRTIVSRTMPAQALLALKGEQWSVVRNWRAIAIISIIAILIGIGIGKVFFTSSASLPHEVTRFAIPFQDTKGEDGYGLIKISPDGSTILYSSLRDRHIYVRSMISVEARVLGDIRLDINTLDVCFSPDSRWIASVSGGKVFKQSLEGGTPITICDAGTQWTGTWTDGGEIVMSQEWGSNLFIVSAGVASSPRSLTTLRTSEGEQGHILPRALPGGKHALFTIWTGSSFDESLIGLVDLATGVHRILLKGGADARYVKCGHIVFSRGATLMAVPFDLESLQVKGEPVPIVEHVWSNGTNGGSDFDISENGTLIYLNGDVDFNPTTNRIVSLPSMKERIVAQESNFGESLFSPDGSRMCVTIYGPTFQVGIYDLGRSVLTPLTFSADNWRMAWLRDGSHITYSSNQSGTYQIYSLSSGGGNSPVLLFEQSGNPYPSSWSRDGSRLAYVITSDSTGSDIWLFALEQTPKNKPLMTTRANETSPQISPDGQWLAYASDATGILEVYLQPFPTGGGKWRLSNGGGTRPVWSPDQKRIYYLRDGVYTVPLTLFRGPTGFSAEPGKPERLVSVDGIRNFDISPDGRSLVYDRRIIKQDRKELNVVLNWFSELGAELQ